MDLTDWGQIAAIAGSPVASIVLAFFVWKMGDDIKALNKSIHENGFVRKSHMDDAWKLADEIHRRHDEDISRLEAEIVRMREHRG